MTKIMCSSKRSLSIFSVNTSTISTMILTPSIHRLVKFLIISRKMFFSVQNGRGATKVYHHSFFKVLFSQ